MAAIRRGIESVAGLVIWGVLVLTLFVVAKLVGCGVEGGGW